MQNEITVLETTTDRELKHKGKLEEKKRGREIRTCSTNVHGFGGNNDAKTEQITKVIEQMSIYFIILDGINCKWKTKNIEKLRNQLTRVSKDVNINVHDSKEHELTKNNYLPGGALKVTIGKLSSCIVESTKKRISWGNRMQLKQTTMEKIKLQLICSGHQIDLGNGIECAHHNTTGQFEKNTHQVNTENIFWKKQKNTCKK